MPGRFTNGFRSMSGSWLARFFAKPHPDAFSCGVFEQGRWRFQLSAVDPYQPDGVVTLRHGEQTLRLRPGDLGGAGPRDGHVVLVAVDADSGDELQLSVPLGEVVRFGIEP